MVYNSLAIAGLPGAGKSALIEKLRSKLGWEVFAIGEAFRKRHKEWQKQSVNNSLVPFEKYWAEHVTEKEIQIINEEAHERVKRGNVILDSRYVPVNVRDVSSSLSIFVIAPLAVRAERALLMNKYPGKTIEEIKLILQKREDDESKRGDESYAHLFGGKFDYRDGSHYSLMLDTSRLSIEEEVEIILSALNRKGRPIIITGSSGVGKTTIAKAILSSVPRITKIVTYTTRDPRPNEINGRDYNFISRQEFENKIKSKEMFEYAVVYGNYYGSSKKDVETLLSSGEDVLFPIDVQGAETLKRFFPESIVIFLLPPSLEELKKRIKNRSGTKDSEIADRLKYFEEEKEKASKFDYQIVNDNLDEAIKEIENIILNSHK